MENKNIIIEYFINEIEFLELEDTIISLLGNNWKDDLINEKSKEYLYYYLSTISLEISKFYS